MIINLFEVTEDSIIAFSVNREDNDKDTIRTIRTIRMIKVKVRTIRVVPLKGREGKIVKTINRTYKIFRVETSRYSGAPYPTGINM